jgi:hypothetical protein
MSNLLHVLLITLCYKLKYQKIAATATNTLFASGFFLPGLNAVKAHCDTFAGPPESIFRKITPSQMKATIILLVHKSVCFTTYNGLTAMFFKKKPSWYWLTMWALVFAGFVFGIARFFLHVVDKESREKPKKQAKKTSSSAWEELFV